MTSVRLSLVLARARPHMARLAWAAAGTATFCFAHYLAGNFNHLSDRALTRLLSFASWAAMAGMLSSVLGLPFAFIGSHARKNNAKQLFSLISSAAVCALLLTLALVLRAVAGGLSV